MVEKIKDGVEFKNPYNIETEKKPEIIETAESNYRITRRVYQQLYLDIILTYLQNLSGLLTP